MTAITPYNIVVYQTTEEEGLNPICVCPHEQLAAYICAWMNLSFVKDRVFYIVWEPTW